MIIKGTIKELVAQGMTVNGVLVDEAMLSVLVRCYIGKVVGQGPKPARGKTPNIYAFESNEIVEIGKGE